MHCCSACRPLDSRWAPPPLFTTTASVDVAHPFYHSSFSFYPFLQLWQKNGFNRNTLHCAKHKILITGPSKCGKNFNLLCFYCAVPFRLSSGLGATWGKLARSGCFTPVTDVSHLFWGMKLKDARAPTGGILFIFFFGLQFWGCSDCDGRLSQVDEADNYA